MQEITTYEKFCEAFKGDFDDYKRAMLLLFIQDWIIKLMNNTSDENVNCSLDALFRNSIESKNCIALKEDAFSYIANEVEDACKHIFLNMREKIIRENVLLPVHKAKEINSYGINWLSRKPGRTVREKMSSNNSIMAVKRRMSLDTGENRLLIAFVKEFHELLQVKIDNMPKMYIDNSEYDFYQMLSSFLKSDEIDEIRRWENSPPNNTLLSDNYYKKVWRAWNELKAIDKIIENSNFYMEERLVTVFYLELLLNAKKYFHIPQVPLEVEYSNYKISIESPVFYGIDKDDYCIRIVKTDNEILIEYKQNTFQVMLHECRLCLLKNGEQINNIHINSGNIKKCVALIITKIGCPKLKDELTLEKVIGKRFRNVVIDLFSVYPEFIADGQPIAKLDSRILQQKFYIEDSIEEKIKEYYVSCEKSDAILLLKDKIETYTVSSAIDSNAKDQMKRLIWMLEKNIITDDLAFIFPDIFNEFQLSMIHKAARLAYRKVKAFPKSIGAIFQYQDSQKFFHYFAEDDFVLVVDLVDDEITFTLVEGVYDEKLYEELSKYKGILWERHPTFSMPCKEAIEEIQDRLDKRGCQTPDILYKIFGKKGIEDEKDKLLCVFGENQYFKITDEVVQALNSVLINITEMVSKFLIKRKDVIGNSKVHIISLSNTFIYKGLCNYQVYEDSDSLIGYSKYLEMKKNIRRPLWRDHLPELAIKRLYGKFDLVNQATVLPNFNAIQEIKIQNTFTLVKNKKCYKFQLVQNDMNSKMQYEAVIKQAAFPLKQDIECKLRMTYRYGAEEPYELIFVPIDKKQAGFIEAKVEWKSISDYEYADLDYPEFPRIKGWDELQNFPGKYNGYEDLTANLAENFERISKGYKTIMLHEYGNSWKEGRNGQHYMTVRQNVNNEDIAITFSENSFEKNERFSININKVSFELSGSKRHTIDLKEPGRNDIWFDKGRGYCCYRKCFIDNEEILVAFFQNKFEDQEEFSTGVYLVSFELIQYNEMYTAVNIRVGQNNEICYNAENIRKGNKPSSFIVSNKNLFAMHEVFFGGRYVNDNNCPERLRFAFNSATNKWIDMYKVCDDLVIKNKIFTMMSMVAKDLGKGYFQIANESIQGYLEGNTKLNDAIGYALGDYTNAYQMELFSSLVKLKPEKVICILSKAIWKNENFVINIPTAAVFYYFEKSIEELWHLCDDFEMGSGETKKHNVFDISMYLEYILAIFRLRQWKDDNVCKKLSLNNQYVQKLYYIVERIIDMNIEIKSHLQLEVDKKGDFADKDIPDLLFVLLVYVTGNKGESDIKISGVNGGD